ncbi:hypothetical protein M9980_00995 [Sphingomonas donggukensis]|uniref:Uncharacterized protein n=1 Tax=Sphingomonas donggukensis TaxID=2949093 RepID=A0ABY4TTX2_9SPHN|nr:hypothetical protein [Sphingomonas donggukensis]URW75842.1 hypothetical protein M9980_00995 [Sphingomonas donggukensis]
MMTTDLDGALRRLSAADHPGLDGIDGAILSGIRARRDSRAGIRMAGIAGVGAIALGALAAGPGTPPASAAPLAPFGAAAPLAPSTLLMTDQ